MPDGAIVANAGHFDLEIDVAGLRQAATAVTEVRPGAVAYHRPSGGRVVVLAEGRLVGQACAEAHPAEVMDLTFATQVLAVERLATAPEPLPAGVHPVPAAVSERVARHKLAAIGVRCDDLTAAQQGYLRGCPGASAPDQPAVQAARPALRPYERTKQPAERAGAVHADRGTGGWPEPDRDGAT